jgi:colanic acid biosynthesis glycosyl transferase WcaI
MVVPPQDSAALGAAICKLADDPRVRLDLGRCARAYAESNFEREAILRRIFGQLDAEVQRVADDAIA